MIGSGLKKLAKESGMRVSSGVAYGSYQGFAATFSEGYGYKRVDFATRFPDPVQKTAFMDAVNAAGVQRTYRVQNMGIGDRRIQVVFTDNPGTMKKIQEFLDWFVPLLRQFGASPVNTCTHCGGDVSSGRWVLMDGTAYFLHDTCAQNLASQIDAGNARRKEEATGSYVTGTLGALLGSVLGAVLWAIVYAAGYVASLAGLVIGILSQKGYNLLKGKQGKGKIVILIIAILFGVVVGTYAGFVGLFLKELGGEYGFARVAEHALTRLIGNPLLVVKDLLLGLLFAALGVFAFLRNAGQAVADDKFVYLP